MAPKNPGLRGRAADTVTAALAAANTGRGKAPAEEAAQDPIVGIGIRMPKSLHRELRRISY